MAKGLVSDTNLTAIANAIRTKNGSSDRYTPATMAQAISDIPTSQVDQESALQWMLNNKTNYAGIAAGLTTLTELPEFTQPSGITDFTGAFKNDPNLTSVSGLTVGNGTNHNTILKIAEMFRGCSKLREVPDIWGQIVYGGNSGSFDGSKNMFMGCSELQEVGIYLAGISGPTSSMFRDCSKLTRVYRPGGTTEQIQLGGSYDATSMFNGCTSLRSVYLAALGSSSRYVSAEAMFYNCSNLTSLSITASSVYLSKMTDMFYGCSSLTSVPKINTDKVGNFIRAFSRCSRLESLQRFDLSSASSIINMFAGCTSLTTTSLDNILASLATATSYTGTKTLKYIGLSSAQATTCTGLSNWAALQAKGWTTGY